MSGAKRKLSCVSGFLSADDVGSEVGIAPGPAVAVAEVGSPDATGLVGRVTR